MVFHKFLVIPRNSRILLSVSLCLSLSLSVSLCLSVSVSLSLCLSVSPSLSLSLSVSLSPSLSLSLSLSLSVCFYMCLCRLCIILVSELLTLNRYFLREKSISSERRKKIQNITLQNNFQVLLGFSSETRAERFDIK